MSQQILTNALIVLPNRTVDGSVVIENGCISEISQRTYSGATDLRGAMLTPGVIDIHTDYLEKEIKPRPNSEFPLEMALHIMDMRAISCGLSTVLSAARISGEHDGGLSSWRGDGLRLARAYEELIPVMRARHFVHVRWDTRFASVDGILEELLALRSIGNVVYNDSVPGDRQFRNMDALIRKQAMERSIPIDESREIMETRIREMRRVDNRQKVMAALGGRFPIGSHDDTTVEHVVEARESGASLCEMPCTIEAARKAKELGMMVCMGAPNYYRGGSHCGNLSCSDALAEGLVDILCSDYHFPSMLGSAARMMKDGMPPSAAMNLLTLGPARHLGLDRVLGSIAVGKKADLTAFHVRDNFADVTHTWVGGVQKFSASEEPREVSV